MHPAHTSSLLLSLLSCLRFWQMLIIFSMDFTRAFLFHSNESECIALSKHSHQHFLLFPRKWLHWLHVYIIIPLPTFESQLVASEKMQRENMQIIFYSFISLYIVLITIWLEIMPSMHSVWRKSTARKTYHQIYAKCLSFLRI